LTRSFSAEKFHLPAVIFAGFVLRSLVALKSPAIEMDGIGYATIAEQFSKGLFREGLNNVFSPMYPFFMSLFHLAVPDMEVAGRVSSVFFGVLLIWVSFLFANRFFRDRTKAVWTAALVAFHPYLVRYSGQVLSESLATLLFALAVFFFYVGWQERSRPALVSSGLCLVMTYLTRPEYLVFYAPLVFLLLRKKRVADCFVLLVPFLLIGVFYISLLHIQTGSWTVSKRSTLSPFVTLAGFVANLPFVSYDFMVAIFPLFFLFAIPGFFAVPRPYRILTLTLVVFHILSLSFISHSTKRYSVEFIPISMVFVTQGVYVVRERLKPFFSARVISCVLAAVLIFMGLIEPLVSSDQGRGLHKQAGLFLLEHDPGSVVAARLPLVAFYAKGKPVDILNEVAADRSITRLSRILTERRVDYLVVDERLEKEIPFLRGELPGWAPVCSLHKDGASVRVYKVS
jgi:hypothetical protein